MLDEAIADPAGRLGRADDPLRGQALDAARELDLEIPQIDGRGEAEDIDAEAAHIERWGNGRAMEHFLQQDEQAATGEIESMVGGQVEPEAASGRLAEFEELLVPDEPPGSRGGWIDGEAVFEEAEGDVAVLAAERIVETRVLVDHQGEAIGGLTEEQIVPAALGAAAFDETELAQAVMRRGTEFDGWFGLGKGEGEQSPEYKFVGRGKPGRAGDASVSELQVSGTIGISVAGLLNQVFVERGRRVERAEGVLDEGELGLAGGA